MLCATPGPWLPAAQAPFCHETVAVACAPMSQPGEHEPSEPVPPGSGTGGRPPGSPPDPSWPDPSWPAPSWPGPSGPAAQQRWAGAGFEITDNVAFLDVPGAPPVTKGDAGMWLLLAAVGFLAGQVVGLVAVYVVALGLGMAGQIQQLGLRAVPPEWYVVSSLVGLWTGFFGAPWLASRVRGTKRFVADLGLRFKWIDLLGIFIGVAGQYLVALLYLPFQKHLHNFNGPTNKLTGGSHGLGFAVIAVLTIVGAPFFEELFFRGLLLKGLARLLTPRVPGRSLLRGAGVVGAVVVDGLLFGLAHGELEQLAGLALFGVILAVVSYRTNRLGMNMVSHASFNAIAVYAVFSARGGVIH